jgi:hypothetical protein
MFCSCTGVMLERAPVTALVKGRSAAGGAVRMAGDNSVWAAPGVPAGWSCCPVKALMVTPPDDCPLASCAAAGVVAGAFWAEAVAIDAARTTALKRACCI